MFTLDKPFKAYSTEDSDTALNVEIIRTDLGGEYPILAMVGTDLTDPDDQTFVRFSDTDGSSKKGKYTLENDADPVTATVSGDASGKVELPAHLQASVTHHKYGRGKVVKVRAHDTMSAYVAFDSGTKKWVFDRKLRLAA